MNKKFGFFISFIFILSFDIYSQSFEVNFRLINQETRKPITGANAFLANSTFGAVSNMEGDVSLIIPASMKELLIISHIGYEGKTLEFYRYSNLDARDTIFLSPGEIDITEVVITSKRSNSWKKNFKKFQEAFLGKDKAAEQCKILNPEVLRFRDIEGVFEVTAIEPLLINNDYLGYTINYSLRFLTIKDDGSIEYLGTAFFQDKFDGEINNEIQAKREKTYLQSPKYFFRSLIENKLEENGFKVELASLNNNQFKIDRLPTIDELLSVSGDELSYQLTFQNFLKITDKNHKIVNYTNAGVRPGGLESRRYSSGGREEKAQVNYAISYLYKISPALILNKYGNVLNSKMMKEYGFWANQRIAYQLPFDYGNEEFENNKQSEIIKENHETKSETRLNNSEKLNLFHLLLYEKDKTKRDQLLNTVSLKWEQGFIPVLIDILGLSADKTLNQVVDNMLQYHTGNYGNLDYYGWLQWMWNQKIHHKPYYTDFRGELYSHVDPKFKKYFKGRHDSIQIRLDEIVWGGVVQDGIPPLRFPEMVQSDDAKYLDDEDVVFGVYIGGIAHAYPKRILGWHEFIVDEVGNKTIAGVYCTLCGTMIIYNMNLNGEYFDLGTSGFLYRSNKLMYDKKTQSLWSTIDGKPVLGYLVGKDIELEAIPVVTTTWKEWKSEHPQTKVISINTGYERDYSEGSAYSDYFAKDDLMFPVPLIDTRLRNKEEVLIVRTKSFRKDPLAISLEYLENKKWFKGKIGNIPIIVLYKKPNIARAYETLDIQFNSYKKDELKDNQGILWKIKEDYLISSDNKRLARIPSHSVFWFAWYNLYPETRLID